MKRYIKYQIPNLLNILERLCKSRIIFFIDLQSIAKGLYKKDNIFFELKYYIENNTVSNCLLDEYKKFLNELWLKYKIFKPFFVTFYDDGKNEQNALIHSDYKGGRSLLNDIIQDDEELKLFYQIKKYYYIKIKEHFTNNSGKVFYLKNYESDMIPYHCISKNLFNSKNSDCLNVILSCDKDLLQCCEFNNTIQCTNRFYSSKESDKRLKIELYDFKNAISYLYEGFKPGNLTAKHIPILLSISGDKADKISGIKGLGYAKAIRLLENHNIPDNLDDLRRLNFEGKLPKMISENFKIIERNIKLISFTEQLSRTKFNEDCEEEN